MSEMLIGYPGTRVALRDLSEPSFGQCCAAGALYNVSTLAPLVPGYGSAVSGTTTTTRLYCWAQAGKAPGESNRPGAQIKERNRKAMNERTRKHHDPTIVLAHDHNGMTC
eukprot:3620758-Rhodomonas_salina.1